LRRRDCRVSFTGLANQWGMWIFSIVAVIGLVDAAIITHRLSKRHRR